VIGPPHSDDPVAADADDAVDDTDSAAGLLEPRTLFDVRLKECDVPGRVELQPVLGERRVP
jgi:hypothetical protein